MRGKQGSNNLLSGKRRPSQIEESDFWKANWTIEKKLLFNALASKHPRPSAEGLAKDVEEECGVYVLDGYSATYFLKEMKNEGIVKQNEDGDYSLVKDSKFQFSLDEDEKMIEWRKKDEEKEKEKEENRRTKIKEDAYSYVKELEEHLDEAIDSKLWNKDARKAAQGALQDLTDLLEEQENSDKSDAEKLQEFKEVLDASRRDKNAERDGRKRAREAYPDEEEMDAYILECLGEEPLKIETDLEVMLDVQIDPQELQTRLDRLVEEGKLIKVEDRYTTKEFEEMWAEFDRQREEEEEEDNIPKEMIDNLFRTI